MYRRFRKYAHILRLHKETPTLHTDAMVNHEQLRVLKGVRSLNRNFRVIGSVQVVLYNGNFP